MPIIPTVIKTASLVKAASKQMVGSKMPPLVSAVASATASYLMMASTVTSTNVCLGPGGGTSTGRIVGLIPSGMSALMMVKASLSQLTGKDMKKLFDSISFGVIQSLKSVVVQGAVIGAGPGQGTGKILGLVPSVLGRLIYTQALFRTLTGDKTKKMVDAMAFGICNHIMTVGTVSLINVGFVTPPVGPVTIPAAPGFGRFV